MDGLDATNKLTEQLEKSLELLDYMLIEKFKGTFWDDPRIDSFYAETQELIKKV